MVMSDDFIQEAQKVVRQYIDDVGDDKIVARTLEKIEKMYKFALDDFYEQFKPCFKGNKELKNQLQLIKNKKVENSTAKQIKIEFLNELIVELIAIADNFDVLPDLKNAYKKLNQDVAKLRGWNIYEQWIDWALEFGGGSYLATHISKLTHSSSKGSSIDLRYFSSCNKLSDCYLTTQPQPKLLDVAYPDNKYSSISQLYSITVDGKLIGDLLRENGADFLCHLTNDAGLLNYWVELFSKKIIDKNKQSYFLSKQIYFPVGQCEYHLLMPLNSSALAHDLHLEHKKRWDEPYKTAFEQRGKGKYSETIVPLYPNKAVLHVTGSNHSNASSLNGKRGGRLYLMPALPPMWNSRLSSYKDKQSLFSKLLAFELSDEIKELSNYLLLLKNKQLSDSEPKRNAAISKKLRAISSQLFNYIDSVNDAEGHRGWSIDSKLDIEYQLLFEPWRDDDAAKAHKINDDWQSQIAKNFGRWLNQQMNKNQKLKLTPIQAALWAEFFLFDLKRFVAVKEVAL